MNFDGYVNAAQNNACKTLSDAAEPLDSAKGLVHRTLDEARELAVRVERLVDQLLGPVSDPEGCGAAPSPVGFLPELRDDARRTANFIREAHIALNRLNPENLG